MPEDSKTYDALMAEVQQGWSDDDHALASAARAHFAHIREEVLRLGESLRARREDLGLSQRQVAKLAGIQPAEMSRIENGKSNPTWTTIQKIAAVLSLDVRVTARHAH